MYARHSLSGEISKTDCRRSAILFLLIVSLLVIHATQTQAVPALDNQSVVVGDVLERTLIDSLTVGIQPSQKLWRFKLRLVSAKSIPGAENVLQGQEGKVIEVYSNEVNAPAGRNGRISVRISFHGDERGGRYWIIGTNETKSK